MGIGSKTRFWNVVRKENTHLMSRFCRLFNLLESKINTIKKVWNSSNGLLDA